MTSPTNPQPTPPAGYEILTPEVARMKPEGMQFIDPSEPSDEWMVWVKVDVLDDLDFQEFIFSAPLGTTALLLTPGPEAGCECYVGDKVCKCEDCQKAHADYCPAHPRNAYVKVLPGWLAGLKEKPEGLLIKWRTDSWRKCETVWPMPPSGIALSYFAKATFALPRHVFDALNRRDPIHDEVAKMDESKLQGEQQPHLADYVQQLHIITGPNGMCRCGEDGITCGERLRQVSHEIADCQLMHSLCPSRTPPPVDGSGPTDGEMLDWLDKNIATFVCTGGANSRFTGSTLRAAIQQAMQSK